MLGVRGLGSTQEGLMGETEKEKENKVDIAAMAELVIQISGERKHERKRGVMQIVCYGLHAT